MKRNRRHLTNRQIQSALRRFFRGNRTVNPFPSLEEGRAKRRDKYRAARFLTAESNDKHQRRIAEGRSV